MSRWPSEMACSSSCKVTSSQRQTRTFTSLSGGCHFAANIGEGTLSLAFVEFHTALNRVVEAAQEIDGQGCAPVASAVDAPADDAAAIDEPGLGESLVPNLSATTFDSESTMTTKGG